MGQISAGQRVVLVRKAPFFASEEAGKAILELVGTVRMKEMRTDFETLLEEAQVDVGTEGVVDNTYSDGYAQVTFDNGAKLDIPKHLLEAA